MILCWVPYFLLLVLMVYIPLMNVSISFICGVHLIVSIFESVDYTGLKSNIIAYTQISKDLGRVKRFKAQEALEYGLIDRILKPARLKPDVPPKDVGVGLG